MDTVGAGGGVCGGVSAGFRALAWVRRLVTALAALALAGPVLALPHVHAPPPKAQLSEPDAPRMIPARTLAEIQRRSKAAEPGAFGTTRFPVASAEAFPQWQSVWRQALVESRRLAGCLRDPGSHPDCARPDWRRWAAVVRTARGQSGLERLRTVNDFFNDWPYREDGVNYGRREAWVSPATFLRHSGDCEDYAIAKYATLRLAGVPDERMHIVVVFDRIRNIRHAVLVVRTADERSVLDSLSAGIFPDTLFEHYQAQYSLNADGQWTHAGGK
jgi:predicted transglutaminase-like cysteine proteinase